MKSLKKTVATIAIAVLATLGLAACAPASPPIEVTVDTVIVDVRTSDEYVEGHLDGAVNIDVQSADFDALVGQLPADGEYILYCASGNRSAAAVDRMRGLGFSDLTDAGGLSEASEVTGIATVTGP